MKEIRVIKIFGKKSYDFGYVLGSQTKKEIQNLLSLTEYIQDNSKKKANEAFVTYKEIVYKKYPKYFEELKGMADGAKVNFDLLLKLNIPEWEMFITDKDKVGYDDCTTLVRKSKGRTQVMHNEDGGSDDDIFLFQGELPSGVKVVSVAYYGYLLGFAANLVSWGFYSCNSLKCKFQGIGIPKRFVTRDALEANNYKKFLSRITVKGRAQAQNYIAVENDKVRDIETSSKDYSEREIKGTFGHANNFVFREMIKFEGRTHRGAGTFLRSSLARQNVKYIKEFKDMKKILSSHVNRPSCICAHGKQHNDINLTLAVIYYDSNKPRQFMLGYGVTCQAVMKEYKLE